MPLIKNCTSCDKPLNYEKEIICVCDKCRTPWHSTCSGLTRADIQLLTTDKRRPIFHCDNCVSDKSQLDELKDIIAKLKKEIEILQQRVAETPVKESSNFLETAIREVRDRISREKNVIVYGIPENTEENDCVTKVLNVIADNNRDKFEPQSFRRLGKVGNVSGKPRPLRVSFNDRQTVINILRNKHKLRVSQLFKNITVKDDQTPYQLNLLKEVRSQLNQRTEAGEKNLTIKYIGGVPKVTAKTDGSKN